MHSSTSSFERLIPAQPWRGLAVVVVKLVLGILVGSLAGAGLIILLISWVVSRF